MASNESHHSTICLLAPLGGALIVLSIFFRLSYGPMGGEISYGSLIWHNLMWDAWPMLLIAWPISFGALETLFGLARFCNHSTVTNTRIHAIATGVLLLLVGGLQLILFIWQAQFEDLLRRDVLISLLPLLAVLIGVGFVLILKSTSKKRLQWFRIIGTSWILVGLFPISRSVPLRDALRIYGTGYWMLLTGTLMLAVVGLWLVATAETCRPNATADEPSDARANWKWFDDERGEIPPE